MVQKKLFGKKAIITGANQGLGFEIAKEFVLAGADIMICARNAKLLKEAEIKLLALVTNKQKIVAKEADISVESDVETVVNETLKKLGGCHILVNNAGIYGPKGEIEKIDWKEWKKTIDINVYGSVLMSKAILPYFKKQKYGKIIQLSGGGATNPLPMLSAYAVSKAAIVRFSETLAKEVIGYNIDVNSIAPGALNTKMLNEIIEAGPDKVGKNFYDKSLKQKETGGTPFNYGASLAVFLASAESDGITGKLISAVWDNWKVWPKYLEKLSSTDIYTLRRIIGGDRNCNWGDK